jgi:hypothetical protein
VLDGPITKREWKERRPYPPAVRNLTPYPHRLPHLQPHRPSHSPARRPRPPPTADPEVQQNTAFLAPQGGKGHC